MIETNQSLENLDVIASVPGVDVLLIGPSDLSIELGVPLDYPCDTYQRALDKIAATAAKRGIAAGIISSRPDGPELLRPEGVQVLHHAVGPLGEGRDPEGPGRDQALMTVNADGPANGQIAQRVPLISRSATPTRDAPLKHQHRGRARARHAPIVQCSGK